MKCNKKHMLLYAVTDRSWTGKQTLYQQVESALKGGVTCVQLREKEMNKDDFLAEAVEIKNLCHKYNVPLIINDDIDIAIKCDADGVHIGQDDTDVATARKMLGDDKILGVSAHSAEEAVEAVKNGADYLGSGAVFATSTKNDVTTLSYTELKKICKSVPVPVVAIGGINKKNIEKLAGSGIDGVALVSAIFAAKDIQKECEDLIKKSIAVTIA